MPDKDMKYKEDILQDEFTSDLKEIPVLSFDEELMDNFDESLLEGEESIIDFVEKEEQDSFIEDELTNETTSKDLLNPNKSINNDIIDNNLIDSKRIIYNDLDKDSNNIIVLTDEKDFEISNKIDNGDERAKDDEDESFYNFHYTNKERNNKENIIAEEKGDKKPSISKEEYNLGTYETGELSKENIENAINNINEEGFYFFDAEEDTKPNNGEPSIDDALINDKENENHISIKDITSLDSEISMDDTIIREEEEKKDKHTENITSPNKQYSIDNINELIKDEEKEDHIENAILEKENINIDNTIIEEKEEEKQDSSLKKIASSIKYAGLSSYDGYKDHKTEYSNDGIKEVLKYFNTLLEELPNDKRKQFISSEKHKLYNKICDKLGIK